MEEEWQVVEFQKMEQERKAAEVVAEDTDDEERPDDGIGLGEKHRKGEATDSCRGCGRGFQRGREA